MVGSDEINSDRPNVSGLFSSDCLVRRQRLHSNVAEFALHRPRRASKFGVVQWL
jgi:hypothetical protein